MNKTLINQPTRHSAAYEVWHLLGMTVLHLLFCTVLILLLGLTVGKARADDSGEIIGLDHISCGTLLTKGSAPGRYRSIPLQHTDVTINVSGLIVRVRLRQTFRNSSDQWLEGIYVFPLPEDAAVDHMRMQIGERIIEGQIKERQAAKRDYQQARREGKKAALVEQERPNLFTNSVANIAPHESVTIEIEYQQVLRYDNGGFRLRFPMAITPRYIPGTPLNRFTGHGWAQDSSQVSDASRITPPVWRGEGKINPVNLTLRLNAGFPIATIESPYHAIQQSDANPARGITTIRFANGEVYAERDFELRWQPVAGQAPRAALFREQVGAEFYYLLMVLPPENEIPAREALTREVIYIIDTSGSMAGTSIEQARQALLLALERLRPGDRFNIIAFNSHTDQLFNTAVLADNANLQRARNYVNGLQATGGTEMYPALQAALTPVEQDQGVRQIIFLTDGSVGNESQLFDLIRQRLGDSRLFTIGIGSAPNSHFMSKAAEFGRGTFTYIGDVSQVQGQMSTLFQKLENPLMSSLSIDSGNATMELYPARLPDLYDGEPLIAVFKSDINNQTVHISGLRQSQPWHTSFQLEHAAAGNGIGALWARDKIAALMNAEHSGENREQIKQQVVQVALQHHLVSKHTSLVAVDVTPARPASESLEQHAMPVNLPHGQVYEKIFGSHARTATTAPLQLLLGTLLLLSALILHRFTSPFDKGGPRGICKYQYNHRTKIPPTPPLSKGGIHGHNT